MNTISAKAHYDSLIQSGDDPVNDSEYMQKYMDRWIGTNFFNLMNLDDEKDVLEVGVGSGRLAVKLVRMKYKSFTGIDLSVDTLVQTKAHLEGFNNISLIASDVMAYRTSTQYDVIYSALTFMHIEDKVGALKNIIGMLKPSGDLVLSLFKVEDDYLQMGDYQVKLYPNNIDFIIESLVAMGCEIKSVEPLIEDEKLLATILNVTR